MSRRAASLLALAVLSFVATACASPTAPQRSESTSDSCYSGWVGSDGKCTTG